MPSPPLSILDCLRGALTCMWRHPADILRAFWPVYLLAIPYWLLDSPPWKIATGLLLSLATVPCACAWHRRIIADEPAKLTLGRPEWNFVKVEMSILVLSVAAFFLSMLVGIFAATILPHCSSSFRVSLPPAGSSPPCFSGYRRRPWAIAAVQHSLTPQPRPSASNSLY